MKQRDATMERLQLARSRLGLVDLVLESWRSVTRDLGRSLVAGLGALLGCAAFTATLGLTGTAAHQISASFDVRRATEVTVTAHGAGGASTQDPEVTARWFTPAAADGAARMAGVVHAGRITTVKAIGVHRFYVPADPDRPVDAYAVDAGALAAIAPHVTAGRAFDFGHISRADTVVMLSRPIAEQLGVREPGSAVFHGDIGFTVIGIYDGVERVPGAGAGVILPITVQEASGIGGGQVPDHQIFLETVPGAATQIGAQAALAISPAQPDLIDVIAPPDPKTLRQEVEGSVTQLSLLVSIVVLALGAISIGNSTAIGVVLRTPEIGLRRALGARRRDIFLQLLGETTALGTLGGVLGALTGVLATIGVALANRWVPVLDPAVPLLAIAAGALAGIVAGTPPAIRATKITPAHALTR